MTSSAVNSPTDQEYALIHRHVDLSIVVELGTRTLTNRLSLASMYDMIAEQDVYELSPELRCELLIVSPSHAVATPSSYGIPIKTFQSSGYYEAKNAGAAVANGRYLVFWDSDCRASVSYLSIGLAALKHDPTLLGVTGISSYDGPSLLSRINTTLSFGYLFASGDTPSPYPALAHNLIINASHLPNPSAPFGHFTGRSGGDSFLTDTASALGKPIRLLRDLRIRHEDPSFSLRALLERHLREYFNIPPQPADQDFHANIAFRARHNVATSFGRRWLRLRRYGGFVGLSQKDRLSAIPLLIAYTFIDLLVVFTVTSISPILDRWLRYQWGAIACERQSAS